MSGSNGHGTPQSAVNEHCHEALNALHDAGSLYEDAGDRLTFSGIGVGALGIGLGLLQPELAEVTVTAGFEGAGGLVAVGGVTHAVGATMIGMADHGLVYGVSAGALDLGTQKLESVITSRIPGGNELTNEITQSLFDGVMKALNNVAHACEN